MLYWRGLIHNLGLVVYFQPKYLWRGCKSCEYFLGILVAVCQKGSGVCIHEFAHQDAFDLSHRSELSDIEQVCSLSSLYLYSLGGVSECIREEN